MKAAIVGFIGLISVFSVCSTAVAVVVDGATEPHQRQIDSAQSGKNTTTVSASSVDNQAPSSSDTNLRPFVARYKSEWDVGWFSIDIKGTRTLKQLENGHWQLIFKADSSAAALKEVSRFEVTDGQIQPLEYEYQVSGLVTEPDRHLEFIPTQEIVRDHKKKRDHTNQWAPGIQDAQTYMLQASLDLTLHPTLPLSYPVFEKKKTKLFNFEIVGEEVIKTQIGKLNTVKIKQVRKDSREVTVWLAKDHQYLLARLVDKKKGKTRYRIDLVGIDS